MRTHFLSKAIAAVLAVLATATVTVTARAASVELLNVSYDPTRELWRELNASFIAQFQKDKAA
jgi:sulfate transport system substrate-binding protein